MNLKLILTFIFYLTNLNSTSSSKSALDLAKIAADLNIMRSLFSNVCWKDSYTRGPGFVVTQCRGTDEQSGELCYPKCENAYQGLGPVCWEKCQAGYADRGIFCIIDIDIYGKGCCCTVWSKNCCNKCRPGYADDGCTCRRPPKLYFKKSYGRGVGYTKGCKFNEQQSGALCYPFCRDGFYGEGPVCWKACKGQLIQDCGAFCAISKPECEAKLEQLINNPIISTVKLINSSDQNRTEVVGDAIMKIIQAYLFFKCD